MRAGRTSQSLNSQASKKLGFPRVHIDEKAVYPAAALQKLRQLREADVLAFKQARGDSEALTGNAQGRNVLACWPSR